MIKKLHSLNSFTYQKNAPVNFQPQDDHLLEVSKSFEFSQMSLYELANAEVYEDGSIFVDGELFDRSLRHHSMEKLYNWKRRLKNKFFKKATVDESKVYLTLNDHWSHEYYHWFFEALPKLEFFLQKMSVKPHLILSSRHKKYQYIHESLERYDIAGVTYLEDKTKILPHNVYFCDYAGPSDFHREELLRPLKSRFVDTSLAKKNIYISRKNARYRKIVNEKEVEELLAKFNFETVYAEDLSFSKQVSLFNFTKNLITIHGAGLANILFMPQNSSVIEIRKDSWGLLKDGTRETSMFYNTYFHICDCSGLNYYYLNAKASDDDISCHYADLTVDVSKLTSLLESLD